MQHKTYTHEINIQLYLIELLSYKLYLVSFQQTNTHAYIFNLKTVQHIICSAFTIWEVW